MRYTQRIDKSITSTFFPICRNGANIPLLSLESLWIQSISVWEAFRYHDDKGHLASKYLDGVGGIQRLLPHYITNSLGQKTNTGSLLSLSYDQLKSYNNSALKKPEKLFQKWSFYLFSFFTYNCCNIPTLPNGLSTFLLLIHAGISVFNCIIRIQQQCHPARWSSRDAIALIWMGSYYISSQSAQGKIETYSKIISMWWNFIKSDIF